MSKNLSAKYYQENKSKWQNLDNLWKSFTEIERSANTTAIL